MIKFNHLPQVTAVYVFYRDDQPLYVGRSVNLKARIRSHIKNAELDPKESMIVNQSNRLKYFSCQSDFEAMLLEAELIKKIKPKYNSRWRDDKSFLYIKITIKDPFPKILIVRREDDKKSLYFGPFSSQNVVYQLVRELRRIVPFCTQAKISKNPCFYSKIGLCQPCPNYIVSLEDKKERQIKTKIYRNNISQVIKILKGNINGILKKYFTDLEQLTKTKKYEEAIKVRERIFRLESLLHEKKFEINSLSSYYLKNESVKALLSILKKYFSQLNNLHRIEAYDVSNFGKTDIVGSMVVFTDGIADKSQYRRFKIKSDRSLSDCRRLEEIIKRRFKNSWPIPNLIIIDGGKPQVRMAITLLRNLNLNLPIIGVAKKPDRLIIGNEDLSMVRLSFTYPGFNLLRIIRDESHRFAKKYHLLLRNKRVV